MMRPPNVDSNGMKKGAWSEDEDNKLRAYVLRYGHWNWRLLPKYAGLARCGKSCRLRWVNYLKPGVKKGNFTKEEEDLIIKLHAHLGNKWSAIATKLPGRTDNEIKNFYHTYIDKHRKRNPSSKKTKHAPIEASSTDDQEATSLDHKLEESTSSSDNNPSLVASTQSQQDLWSDIFKADTNYNQTDIFPPLTEDDFLFAQLSSSDSSYMSALDWIANDANSIVSSGNVAPLFPESFWSESSAMNIPDYQTENPDLEAGGFYDPSLECFDYGISLFI